MSNMRNSSELNQRCKRKLRAKLARKRRIAICFRPMTVRMSPIVPRIMLWDSELMFLNRKNWLKKQPTAWIDRDALGNSFADFTLH